MLIYFFIFSIFQSNKELAQSLHLRDPSYYRYLNASGSVKIEILTESRRFEALRLAFTVLQIPQPMVDGIFRVLSAILWLGNLDFEVIIFYLLLLLFIN